MTEAERDLLILLGQTVSALAAVSKDTNVSDVANSIDKQVEKLVEIKIAEFTEEQNRNRGVLETFSETAARKKAAEKT